MKQQDKLSDKEWAKLRSYCEKLSLTLQQDPPGGLRKPSPLYRGGMIVPLHKGQGRVVCGPFTLRYEIEGRSDYSDYRVRIYSTRNNRSETFVATCRLENLRGDGWHVALDPVLKARGIRPLYTASRFPTPQAFCEWYIEQEYGDYRQAAPAPAAPAVPVVEPQRPAQHEPLWEYLS